MLHLDARESSSIQSISFLLCVQHFHNILTDIEMQLNSSRPFQNRSAHGFKCGYFLTYFLRWILKVCYEREHNLEKKWMFLKQKLVSVLQAHKSLINYWSSSREVNLGKYWLEEEQQFLAIQAWQMSPIPSSFLQRNWYKAREDHKPKIESWKVNGGAIQYHGGGLI